MSVNFAPDEIKQNPRQNVRATPREVGRCHRIWRTSRPGSSVTAKAKSGRTAGEAQGRGARVGEARARLGQGSAAEAGDDY